VPLSHDALGVIAASTGSGSDGGGGGLLGFLPFILIFVVGYLLLVRPARNRQRKAMENRAQLVPGVEVTTTAGLLATVVAVDDDTVTLEVAPGVHSRYVKGAIARVHTPLEPDLEDGPTGPPEEQIPAPETDTPER
jgi:preprotein translocase subunit YajC